MAPVTRRAFLGRASVVGVAVAAPITAAIAEARVEPIEDSDMKCMRLARELFNAMKAHYGDGCKMIRHEDSGELTFLPPPPAPRIVEFDGAAWYDVETSINGPKTERQWIEVAHHIPASPTDGRWFMASADGVTPAHYYQESWLRTIIIRKVEGLSNG